MEKIQESPDVICAFCAGTENLTTHHALFPKSVYKKDPRREKPEYKVILCEFCHAGLHWFHQIGYKLMGREPPGKYTE